MSTTPTTPMADRPVHRADAVILADQLMKQADARITVMLREVATERAESIALDVAIARDALREDGREAFAVQQLRRALVHAHRLQADLERALLHAEIAARPREMAVRA